MKKLFTLTLAATLILAGNAQAELEFSGNGYVIMGLQYSNDETAAASFGTGIFDANFANPGSTVQAAEELYFGFGVESMELDGSYTFGENVRLRFDLDFADETNNGGVTTGLEQGYVTFGISTGNTLEVAVGKFNAPVGLEHVDRVNNRFVTYTSTWTHLMPKNVIGANLYYEFNDSWNMNFALVNSLNNYNIATNTTSPVPSALLRFGGVWGGDEDNMSSFNIALGTGLEHSTTTGQGWYGNTGQNDEDGIEIFGDIWGELVFNYFTLGYELTARGTSGIATSGTQWAFGGQLYGVYAVSDTMSIQARYALHYEGELKGDGASTTGSYWNASLGAGDEGMFHQGTLGLTHSITDGADVTVEYNFSYGDGETTNLQSMTHSGVVGLGYSF